MLGMTAAPPRVTHPTGLDLRLARTARLLSQTAVAAEMGCSRQYVGLLESLMRPGPATVARYQAALNRLAER